MGKTKKIVESTPKLSLTSKISKRKSLKRSAAITPKLKKLSLAQAKAVVFEKIPSPSASEESVGSENEVEVNKTIDIKSPRHFIAPPKSPIDLNQVQSGVKALFEYIQNKNENKTELFDDEQPIFLQIISVKVPKTPNRQIRLTLKHSLLTESSEICLIVKDEGKAKDHDGTIEHYEEILKDKGIVIKTIMPYHQFKTEYGNQYELVRKLLGLYDYFLVDGRVGGYVTHQLGKIFLEKRKMPTPVKMDATNLKEHFETSLRKTLMKLHAKSDCYNVQVGHSKMDVNDVFENISEIINELDREFPGGLDNIRSFGLKTDKSITIPIYLTLKNKSTVDVPVISAKRPKQFQKVTGELTTFLDKDVTVLPTGEIIVVKQKMGDETFNIESGDGEVAGLDLEEDGDENLLLGSEEEADKDEEENVKITDVKEQLSKDVDDDEEEDGGVLDQAEEIYLNQYEKEQTKTRKVQKVSKNKEITATKRPKRAVNENKNTEKEPEINKQPVKKITKRKKQTNLEKRNDTEDVVQEEAVEAKTRSTRSNKPKPEKEIALKKPKKAGTKKDDTKKVELAEEKLKIKLPTGKNKDNLKKENEKEKTKKSKKATKKTKVNEEGQVEDKLAEEIIPSKKTSRKTKAKNVEEVIPTKKSKIIKKEIEEEKPSKGKGKSKVIVATESSTKDLKKNKKKLLSNEENIKVKKVSLGVTQKGKKKATVVSSAISNTPISKKLKKANQRKSMEVKNKKGKEEKVKSPPTMKVKKGKK